MQGTVEALLQQEDGTAPRIPGLPNHSSTLPVTPQQSSTLYTPSTNTLDSLLNA